MFKAEHDLKAKLQAAFDLGQRDSAGYALVMSKDPKDRKDQDRYPRTAEWQRPPSEVVRVAALKRGGFYPQRWEEESRADAEDEEPDESDEGDESNESNSDGKQNGERNTGMELEKVPTAEDLPSHKSPALVCEQAPQEGASAEASARAGVRDGDEPEELEPELETEPRLIHLRRRHQAITACGLACRGRGAANLAADLEDFLSTFGKGVYQKCSECLDLFYEEVAELRATER